MLYTGNMGQLQAIKIIEFLIKRTLKKKPNKECEK